MVFVSVVLVVIAEASLDVDEDGDKGVDDVTETEFVLRNAV